MRPYEAVAACVFVSDGAFDAAAVASPYLIAPEIVVAFFLTPAKLKELWIVPVIFAVVTVTSMIVGWVLAYVFRLKRSQRCVHP